LHYLRDRRTYYSHFVSLIKLKPPCHTHSKSDKTAGGHFQKKHSQKGAAAFTKFTLGKGRPFYEKKIHSQKGAAAFTKFTLGKGWPLF